MNRRHLLVGVGGLTATSLAGCLDDAGDGTAHRSGNDDHANTGGDRDDRSDGGNDQSDDWSGDADDGNDVGGETDDRSLPQATVDEPPYPIERPDLKDTIDDEWDHHYLGAEMSDEPSLAFEHLEVHVELVDPPIVPAPDASGSEYAVRVATSAGEQDDLLVVDGEALVDYDESILAVVHSGYGSSSQRHRWRRVEETDDGVHLHGYYTSPREQTSDYGPRYSLVEIERSTPEDVSPTAHVSLTVDEATRVTFDSTETAWASTTSSEREPT